MFVNPVYKTILLVLFWVVGSGSYLHSQLSRYRFPMDGHDFLVSGTFGELRNAHFHAGLDVKTDGLVGKPILAVADGYVYRVHVSPDVYGNALYIRHSDGNISLYAHLSRFAPLVDAPLFQRQYATKRWEQDLYFNAEDLPVRAGQVVGYSGNSGHSMGPHLHLEIRDSLDQVLNPLIFFKHLIRDDVPPVLQRIAFQPLSPSSRIGGRLQKLELQPQGSNGQYAVPGVVEINGEIGLEYQAFDLLSGAPNPCGINYATLWLDNQLLFEYRLDQFKWDDKKDIDIHFDYAHFLKTGRRLERCYGESGVDPGAYPRNGKGGRIELYDEQVHQLKLELRDVHGNRSTCRVQVRKGSPQPLPTELSFAELTTLDGQFEGNQLVARLRYPSTRHLMGLVLQFPELQEAVVRPAWYENQSLFFVVDLASLPHLPLALVDPVTGKRIVFDFQAIIDPSHNTPIGVGSFSAIFPMGCTYGRLPLKLTQTPSTSFYCSDFYQLGQEETPLRGAVKIGFDAPASILEEHLVVAQKSNRGNWVFVGNEKGADGRIYADILSMGTFCLMADSVPPTIQSQNFVDGGRIGQVQNELVINIEDSFSGINPKRCVVTLDGEWVLCSYDHKTHTLTHGWWRRPDPGVHTLDVMVFDKANNLARRQFKVYF